MSPPITATYRLQFNREFRFADARALVPYVRDLGISHLYASPISAARPGSSHGYDVVDPTVVSEELGGMEEFRRLVEAARAAGLGLILDIVPNHMAADRHNGRWMETLCLGRRAPAADMFDIDWHRGRLVLPVLGGPPAEVLERGEIGFGRDGAGWIAARYFDHAFPLRPESVAALVEQAGGAPQAVEAWRSLEDEPTAEGLAEAQRALRAVDAAALDAVLAEAPAALIDAQHWRLAHWRAAERELTHRRFFNINDLVGVRVEDPAVFEIVHRLPLALVAEGSVDGLRVDHVDGLADPEAYCRRLREAMGPQALLVVEKILEGDEALRPWPVDGTTGYERLNDINGLYIDADGHRRLDGLLVRHALVLGSPKERLIAAKRQVVTESFGSELDRLAAMVAGPHPAEAWRHAVLALVVHCPVYRSYATERGYGEEDEAVWRQTLADVAAHEEAPVQAAAEALIGRIRSGAVDLALRLQQLSGPAMAKGLEDTAFYRSLALASANEVGGDLEAPARSIETFHRRAAAAVGRRGLVPLATHDTKRGADTRARINLISLDSNGFLAAAARWSAMTQLLRQRTSEAVAPDALDEWLIWQTLVGVWPISGKRLAAYLTKAMREAKRHTSWEAPNWAYEDAACAFASALIEAPATAEFRADIAAFVAGLQPAARLASIAQTVLQLTAPGIPDIYRGTELWDLTLVDPDNRRPVDWEARQAAAAAEPPLPRDDDTGASKLHVMRRLLTLRRDRPALFLEGDYRPLDARSGAGRWIAFERRAGEAALLVAVPTRTICEPPDRLALPGLPPAAWHSAFDDAPLDVDADGIAIDRERAFLVALGKVRN